MKGPAPHNFEFHKYLQSILGVTQTNTSFFLATEKDFAKTAGIDYPYRSYFYAVGLMHKGDCNIKVGINDYEIKDRTLSLVGPGIVRQWIKNDWRAINHTIFFKPDFFEQPLNRNFLLDYVFFKAGANCTVSLTDEDYQKAVAFIRLLETHAADKKVLQGLMFAFLEFISQIQAQASKSVGNSQGKPQISQQFSQLLHQHYRHEKDVTFYADQLHLTTKNLSVILQKETGAGAKKMIDAFLIFEAQSLLKQTPMSVKEIMYWLGYEDPSYFTKFFKNKVGVTPVAYRNQ